jgi:hypothetical protein
LSTSAALSRDGEANGNTGAADRTFFREHHYRDWTGRLLTLGRQTIYADGRRLRMILDAHGIPWDPDQADYDHRRVQATLAKDQE